VRDKLGVGLGGQLMPLRRHLGTQHGEVLDDAVVHDGQVAAAVDMRVRIRVSRRPVSGPASVAEAHGAGQSGLLGQRGPQVAELACPFHPGELPLGDNANASRVIAAVLQPAQAFQDDIERLPMAGVPHNSAHDRQASACATLPIMHSR